MHSLTRTLLTFTAMATLASCSVGPDFMTPAAPDVKTYTDTEMPAKTAGAEGNAGAPQSFAQDKEVPADWWAMFGSDALNKLMDQALKANPDLKAASAALRQARETYYAARGEYFPSVDGSVTGTREKLNSSAFGAAGANFPSSIFTLYDASVSVSYNVDIFGGTRRAVEAAHAQEDYQKYQYAAAYLTLTTNVVTAAIQEASLREQIKETQNIVDIESKQLDTLRMQFNLGASPKATVLEQEAALAQTQATLPPLQKQLAQTRNQLAVLSGQFPANADNGTFEIANLKLPEELPLTLPAKLTQQRPDVKAAEAQLHTASAEVGVATANMFPQISITGNYGSEAIKTGNLFTSGAEAWSIGAGLTQPIFHGGTLLHQKRAAVAAYDQATAQYQSTVLAAFKNVADTLRALQYDAEGLAAQVNSANAAKSSLDLAQTQFKVGAISYPQLLDAERTYAQARVGLVQAQASRLADTVALFQSLGGGWQGWQNKDKEKPATTAAKDSDQTKQPPLKNEKKS